MIASHSIIRAVVQILAGQGGSQIIGLLRNLVIARLVSTEDFGIAATFALTISLLQVISDLSWDKMLIQDPRGDDPDLQSTIQTMMIVRGLLTSLAIFLLADEIAAFFGVPNDDWAYEILAIAPLIRGFDHLDFKRVHRRMNFSLEARVALISQASALLAAVFTVMVFADYRAMLVSVLVQSATYTIVSHILAERPYCLGFSKALFIACVRFGWPLAINAVVFFLAAQGDRFVVGGWLGADQLAIYTSIVLIQSAVLTLLMSVLGSIGLSILSRSHNSTSEFSENFARLGVVFAVVSLVVFVPLIFVCHDIVLLTFGARYQSSFEISAILVVGTAINFLRVLPITGQLAMAQTKSILLSNVVRTVGFFMALLAVQWGAFLHTVALCMVFGEVLAVISAFAILKRSGRIRAGKECAYMTAVCIGLLVASAFSAFYLPDGFFLHVVFGAVAMGVSVAMLMLLSETSRRTTIEYFHQAIAVRRELARRKK